MLINVAKLTGTGLIDAATIPAIMLGFRPTESCTVMGVDGTRILFCARMDLEWLNDEPQTHDLVGEILAAASRSTVDAVMLVGYSDTPTETAQLLEGVALRLGFHVPVALCAVASHDTVWEVLDGQLLDNGIPFSLDDELRKVEAVTPEGVRTSRTEAVAEVRPVLETYEAAEVVLATADALQRLDNLTNEQAQVRLNELIDGPTLTWTRAVETAVLLDNPEHVGHVLGTIVGTNAAHYRAQLLATRRYCPQGYEPNVIGLLALSCWLTGEGAQMIECMHQLEGLNPTHPILIILQRLHHLPPTIWE